MRKSPEKRIGAGVEDAREIKKQRFFVVKIFKKYPWFFKKNFQHIQWNWDSLLGKQIRPKFVPIIHNPEDVSNFDEEWGHWIKNFYFEKYFL